MMESAPAYRRKVIAAVSRRAAPDSVWKDIWNNRSILWLLVRRDLKSRYAGSMLGVMWNIINPVVMIIIYILILGTILGGKLGGDAGGQGNYALHLCAGHDSLAGISGDRAPMLGHASGKRESDQESGLPRSRAASRGLYQRPSSFIQSAIPLS